MKTNCGNCGKEFDTAYEYRVYGNSFMLSSLERGLRYVCFECVKPHENAKQETKHQPEVGNGKGKSS